MARAKEKIALLPVAERARLAKEKADRLVDHLIELIGMHANNKLVVYSPILASQIPESFAAHAFIRFQQALYRYEIVRVCALWDAVDLNRENIPTVVALIDSSQVIDMLAGEAPYWDKLGVGAKNALVSAIAKSKAIIDSDKLTSTMNLRDKAMAHSLEKTWREDDGPVAPMKYGYEKDLLEATIPLVSVLQSHINGKGFDFDNSIRIANKNAEALWTACTFKIER